MPDATLTRASEPDIPPPLLEPPLAGVELF